MKPEITIILSAVLVAGCSWNALNSQSTVPFAHVAFSDVEKRHPGKHLLLLSVAGFDHAVAVQGLVCTSHDYPLDAAKSFETSLKKSLANLVEEIEIVSAPMTQKQIKVAKARALITITADRLSGQLLVSPGFLTKDSQATIKMSARVEVLKPRGKPFERLASSTETNKLTIGRCLDAHKTVYSASSAALRQLIEEIGTSVSQALSAKK